MAGRVDQVELVHLAVLGRVVEPDGLRLDGDAALALDIHLVEELVVRLTLGERARDLEDAVGERGFAVIDVRDDREIADEARGRAGMCGTGRVRRAAGALRQGRMGDLVPLLAGLATRALI